jgi:1,4-alpha-glucan branching enzyme
VSTRGSLLTEQDLHLFNEGTHYRLYHTMGAHPRVVGGKVTGVSFAVWAPNARQVSVIGDFNRWENDAHPLRPRGSSGIWEGFVPGLAPGASYKYHLVSRHDGYAVDKADPFAFRAELAPQTASVVWDLEFPWTDHEWMETRGARQGLRAPISIYEVHLGSWRRAPDDPERLLTARELAEPLAEYVREMGFTHVELLPVMEHPFYGSWGYQVTGYYAASSRYGTPQDLMFLVDTLHRAGIGVLLDWVPSHFPSDEHGLVYFDGPHLFEHADPRQGFHPDWKTYIFNYGRPEVRAFLISNALFWLDRYHADGLRVDAVASMLYLDYSRAAGEWVPNAYGGRENLEAIDFLRTLNEKVYAAFPGVQTIAEESTAWPLVSRPLYRGGLGFGLKWDMGWMHDTLEYMGQDPVFRKYHHGQLTFRNMYAYSENFVLPLSHDEVVHMKGSLLYRMPGDDWRKRASLRLLFAHMWSQPGKKLLFMGGELGQWREWNHDASLDWHLLADPAHEGLRRWVADLNRLYRDEGAMHRLDTEPAGFEWVDCHDAEASVLVLMRRAEEGGPPVLIALNFTPLPRENYRVGVPTGGFWRELLNSDATSYGGTGMGNMGGVEASPVGCHGRPWALTLTLPPLAAVFLAPEHARGVEPEAAEAAAAPAPAPSAPARGTRPAVSRRGKR